MTDDIETAMLAHPQTVWQESIRLEKDFAQRMKRLRYRAFAAEWRQGKTVDEVAKTLRIPLSHACMVVMRARAELGEVEVPRRNKLKRLRS